MFMLLLLIKISNNLSHTKRDFKIGLLTYAWVNAMTLWSELTHTLMSIKSNKYLYFQRGLKALSQLQQQLELYCHP
ncbi:MAG: hypothetical protein F6K56_16470 [Moorea sp. SIO3G5]|nr:hypothetical protein [Moorena sp. SIO3G5]